MRGYSEAEGWAYIHDYIERAWRRGHAPETHYPPTWGLFFRMMRGAFEDSHHMPGCALIDSLCIPTDLESRFL